MNYSKIYDDLIQKRIATAPNGTDYTEMHHIIPRSFGGSDSPNNLVKLTTREHFVAHLLLVKINWNDPSKRAKMLFALKFMKYNPSIHNRYFNSRLYEYMRNQFISDISSNIAELKWFTNGVIEKRIRHETDIPDGWYSGRTRNWSEHTEDTKRKLSEKNKEHVTTDATKLKISENNYSKRNPEEHRKHASVAGKIGGGKKKSKEHIAKISISNKSMVTYTDGKINLRQHKDLPVPEGFRRGMTTKRSKKF